MSNNQTEYQTGHGQDNAQRDHRDAEAIAAFNRCEAAGMTPAFCPSFCEPEPNNNAVAYTGDYRPTSPEYTEVQTSLN